MTDDIAKVARELRPQELDALMGSADADMLTWVALSLSLSLKLLRPCKKDRGLPATMNNMSMEFSPLGLAVRAHLMEKPDA